ncbi:MAG: type II toxin-antitoxin system RelE/ParE family toxin [Janthinobacterium lividum]
MNARYTVTLTREAIDDIDGIRAYLVDHRSVEAADDLIDTIVAAVATLETFPMRGVVPKELAAVGERDFRQLNLGPYRLIYYIVETMVAVTLVVDGRRDLPELLARRLLAR